MSICRQLVARGVLLALLGSVGWARAETLVIAGDIWCPVNCQPGSERPGIFVELAREIFAESGIEVQYQALNWARTLQQVRRGQLNAAIGAGVEDAPDFLFGATPVASSRNCFFTLPDSTWRFTGTASLAGQRLGVINDYSYGDELNTYIALHHGDSERIQIAAGDTALTLNIGKLMHGRVDVVLENAWVMQAMLASQGQAGGLREAGCRTPDVPIYLAFSPALESSPRYLALFEQGVQRYRANGRLQALLAAYGVQSP
ncbi:substrate-binding periplasmic protein [Pseudomonas sp. NPDC079086]|jgi:polar amino acid transport system substrate-binding protein|uniref:substrate-binding periplasmic protein n=1 Tax=unclassified Pseudomonas TaxID=196821 RepID=UPI001D31DC8A|nr:transporter substrate-binding domain-containing protein [Gammaproteobacteria bacterium]MBU2155445.1 transporter substrate-binding domain-containing protein [Gammaproteobacteria bacterium]MBU2254107.1 transporter substrate-binding domain-containing protein [Gammaproteobacteria bacterium]